NGTVGWLTNNRDRIAYVVFFSNEARASPVSLPSSTKKATPVLKSMRTNVDIATNLRTTVRTESGGCG
ncbi:MAG: hypothetical protein KJO36_06720, partial [Acidimicrobiia bacterium]|nr:hypothetical protein [Acidimicrobiia bacterium]